jgi:hypothetical protein
MIRRPAKRAAIGFYWLVPAAFLAHIAEELPRFPRWATEHFGTTTTRFYVASHALVLVPATFASANRAASRPGDHRAAFFATTVATGYGLNAIFHVATTALFRRYSPGLITAVALVLPASAYTLWRTREDSLLTDEQLLGAVLTGTALADAAIGSLYINMPRLGSN